MSDAAFIVGIDLGTTNCALAFVRAGDLAGDSPVTVEDSAVLQLERPGSVVPKPTLPSFIYLPKRGELPEGSMDLPWAAGRDHMVGHGAKERGAQVPLRLVSSAKSWLCHAGVDRRAALLPFQAPPEVEKLSPIAAATTFLSHLREAWDDEHPDHSLDAQAIFLTVPASFDAAARDLTVEAARRAGLANLTLLEEPQSAFYAWLARVGDAWREQLSPDDRVLVCDVGGGTTDFSLIEVTDAGGNLALERVAVGEHILLGGDNMDLALAHHLGGKLRAEKKKLDAQQSRALVQAARDAKERLLSDREAEAQKITILGRGSKLIGGKITTELTRAELEAILVDGFFPRCGADAAPQTARRTGFAEIGLPFAVDAGVTRHLAQFLAKHTTSERPVTHVLLNGGVFNGAVLQDRLMSIVSGWTPRAPTLLPDADLDLAVARGAAYFGATRLGKGIRIRGGVARSYYIGIETPMPSVPGVEPPIRALCVVPFGMEEGSELTVPGGELGLVVGQPVAFRFLSATDRKDDQPGFVLDEYTWPDHVTEGPPLEATLEAEGLEPGTLVPVRLEVKVTEIGTVEIWSAQTDGSGRWRLEFNVREQEDAEA